MKKVFSKITNSKVFNFIVLMLAVFTGGFTMAAAIGEEGNEPLGKSDPGDPANPEVGNGGDPNQETNGRLAPGDKTAGQSLDGTQASSTQLNEGGLVEDEWDQELVTFQPWKHPLLTVIRKVTRKQNISNWSVKHPRVGGETLDGFTKKAITAGDD